MSQADKKWWLVRLGLDNVVTNHLLYQDDLEFFKSNLSSAIKIIYYGQASWQTMHHLTGCVIPDKMRMHNYAVGPLAFERNNQEVTLHPR